MNLKWAQGEDFAKGGVVYDACREEFDRYRSNSSRQMGKQMTKISERNSKFQTVSNTGLSN
jgi:hypothetical protein